MLAASNCKACQGTANSILPIPRIPPRNNRVRDLSRLHVQHDSLNVAQIFILTVTYNFAHQRPCAHQARSGAIIVAVTIYTEWISI